MRNRVAIVIACLLMSGLVLSAIPASGKGDKVKKLSNRLEALEDVVKKNENKLNKLHKCFATTGVKANADYGYLEFNSKNPEAFALKNSCS